MNEKLNIMFISALLGAFLCSQAVAQSEILQLDNIQPGGFNSTGITALKQLDPSLDGSGIKYAVISRSYTYINNEPQNDYRPFIEHNCFSNTSFDLFSQADLPIGISPHSTNICSVLFGRDTDAYNPMIGNFSYEGVTPQAEIGIYEFLYFIKTNVYEQIPPDADILNISLGQQFEAVWTRGIESLAEKYGIIVVASIGNGTSAYDPVLYPAAGANVIGVGVIDSAKTYNTLDSLEEFALAYPEHSSFGPTVTGRCKPDLVAPGNYLAASIQDINQYDSTGNWSSFSSPVVSGVIGLLLQKAKQDSNLTSVLSTDGGNSLIKSLLLNSATKLPYWHKGLLNKDDDHMAPLDYIQGAGMVNAIAAYEQLISGEYKPGYVPTTGWDLNVIDANIARENSYKLIIEEPNDQMITVTAAWNKHYSDLYNSFESLPEKDCNYRLELWAVDSQNPFNTYLLDYSDSTTDNVEHIYVTADPAYTEYEVIVTTSTDQLPAAFETKYGLTWNVGPAQESDNIFWYDLNADGIVNNLDFNIMYENITKSSEMTDSYVLGDINGDGSIDGEDLTLLLDHNNMQADWYIPHENTNDAQSESVIAFSGR